MKKIFTFMALAAALLLTGACNSKNDSDAKAEIPIPITFGTNLTAKQIATIKKTEAIGFKEGMMTECETIHFDAYPTLDNAFGATEWDDPEHPGECKISFNKKDLDKTGDWKWTQTIDHEIAHSFALNNGHGSLWAAYLKNLDAKQGITDIDIDGDFQPDCWKMKKTTICKNDDGSFYRL